MTDPAALLEDLTGPQTEAVTHVQGPLLIVAAAGSGKTRVITRRVAYLISQGIVPSSILAITFTNKAAGEMKQRVAAVLDRPLRDWGRLDQPSPLICTFHSLCLRVLKHYAPAVGLPANFAVFDSADQNKLVKESIKALDLSTTNFPASTLHGTISNAKNKLLTADQYAAAAGDFYSKTVARVYLKYQAMLKANNALDFDDLLLETAHAFRKHPQVLKELQERFRYILIDEYQDTNHAQYIIAHALAQRLRNLAVVGDPDQCLPPGTLVRTPRGPCAIEDVREGDDVTSAIGWSKSAPMPVEKVMVTDFKGRLVRIQTGDGCELRATPNHMAFAKLRVDPAMHYTYLMWKRGVGYRIGTTRGVRASEDGVLCSGLQVRTNQEVADAVWVLHCTPSSAEARFFEHFYSVRYGVPTMVFFVRGRRMDMTQAWIDRLYRDVDSDAGAERLMEALHLDRRYPHHRTGGVTRTCGGVKDAPWSRRHVLFTVFGGPRLVALKAWHEHRVQLVTTDPGLRESAARRFRVRDSVRGTWRIETSRKHYDEGLALARDVASLHAEMELVPRARLTPDKSFLFMPVSHIHPGMVVPVCEDGEVRESVVAAVEWEDYEGPVYDLSVPQTRNYVAGGIVVHNSIYAWRGADIRNILDFEKDYPDAKVVKLEQNYRSTKTVLAIAGKLIANNTQRKDKSLWTENAQGDKAALLLCQDEHDEAEEVTRRLKDLHEKAKYDWNAMAIFYRMNSLSRVMEDALRRSGVPYQIARGVEFYNRKEIKDVLAYLRAVANPDDEVSLSRIANVPTRGIGDASVKTLQAHAFSNGLSLWGAMKLAPQVPGLSTRAVNGVRAFVSMMESFRAVAAGTAAAGDVFSTRKGLVQAVMEDVVKRSGLEAMLLKEDPDKENQVPNVNELVSSAAEYDKEHPDGTLDDYLSAVSLVSDADHLEGAGGAITLMTLHAAKGLEFKVVAMIGLEEGCLPHARARGNLKELEEERRLCFVGITRARERLILSRANYRTIRGLRERTVASPFLNELPQELLDVADRTSPSYNAYEPRTGRRRDRDEAWAASESSRRNGPPFQKGQLVRHPAFGLGRIAELTETGSQTRAVVEFNTAGKKTLILEYARLELVG